MSPMYCVTDARHWKICSSVAIVLSQTLSSLTFDISNSGRRLLSSVRGQGIHGRIKYKTETSPNLQEKDFLSNCPVNAYCTSRPTE